MENTSNRLIKHSGQVFTPNYLVRLILDSASYFGENILCKHVIDNSCGDGAFLCEIVERYIKVYLKNSNNLIELKVHLETFIHGIELDPVAYNNCLYNLSVICETYNISDVKWNILNGNSLKITKFDNLMDFVIGNPPYVRVHNLEDDYNAVKSFRFAQDGMTDLYLVFFELGLRMLNKTGRLCYITPSSWLTSLAASNMRKYIMLEQNLVELIDLGHFQAFENATTYTLISIFDMCHNSDFIKYYSFDTTKYDKIFIDNITYQDLRIGENFYLGSKSNLESLKKIKTLPAPKYVSVKNGFATLADKVFILNVNFSNLTIPVLKASTGKWHRGFFPYDTSGKPYPKDYIFSFPEIAQYLSANKETLLKGKTEIEKKDWYLYGRTQALKDVFNNKYAINTVIRDINTIKLNEVPYGSGLYSGLYILTNAPYNVIKEIVISDDFINYISMLKNYKSGGYYTFNSKDLEQYLNFKLYNDEKTRNIVPIDKRRVLEGYLELF